MAGRIERGRALAAWLGVLVLASPGPIAASLPDAVPPRTAPIGQRLPPEALETAARRPPRVVLRGAIALARPLDRAALLQLLRDRALELESATAVVRTRRGVYTARFGNFLAELGTPAAKLARYEQRHRAAAARALARRSASASAAAALCAAGPEELLREEFRYTELVAQGSEAALARLAADAAGLVELTILEPLPRDAAAAPLLVLPAWLEGSFRPPLPNESPRE